MKDKSTDRKRIAWSLWIPVLLAFLLVSTAWFILIKIASAHPTEQVEISHASGEQDAKSDL